MAKITYEMMYEAQFYRNGTHQCWYRMFSSLSDLQEYLRLENHYDELVQNKNYWTVYNDVVITDIRGPQLTPIVVKDSE